SAQGTVAARQLRARRYSIPHAEPRHPRADLYDSSAEFVSKELHRSLMGQALPNSIETQRGDPEGQLRFGNAGLHADDLGDHVSGPARRFGNVVQPQITEIIEAPGFHPLPLADHGWKGPPLFETKHRPNCQEILAATNVRSSVGTIPGL